MLSSVSYILSWLTHMYSLPDSNVMYFRSADTFMEEDRDMRIVVRGGVYEVDLQAQDIY